MLAVRKRGREGGGGGEGLVLGLLQAAEHVGVVTAGGGGRS